MTILFERPPVLAPTVDGRAVAVRRVFCVGQNYAAHAREMGADPSRAPPFFFTKPADAVVPGPEVPYPSRTDNLHHEVELVVALGAGGRDIPVAAALDHVFGYAVGLDLTRRDLQAEAKAAGRPWDMAKGFDASGPLGLITPAAAIGHPQSGAIVLDVNGQTRQSGDLSDMIWSVAEVIAALSAFVALEAGDLIFTGTPEGVGAIAPGDVLAARIDGLSPLTVRIGA